MDTDNPMGNPPDDVATLTAFFESQIPNETVPIFDLSHLENKLDAFQLPQAMSVRHLQERITRFSVRADLSLLDSVDDALKSLELQRELDDQHRSFEAPKEEMPEQKPIIHNPALHQDEQKPAINEEPGINEEQKAGIREEPDCVKFEDGMLPAVKKSHCSFAACDQIQFPPQGEFDSDCPQWFGTNQDCAWIPDSRLNDFIWGENMRQNFHTEFTTRQMLENRIYKTGPLVKTTMLYSCCFGPEDFRGLKAANVPEKLKAKETGVFLKKKTITGE
ncbi:unnamed protein product [Calypogeia fissa]